MRVKASAASSGREDVASMLESFAKPQAMKPSDRFSTVMDGSKRDLSITAIVVSPKFVYAVGRATCARERRFGVVGMLHPRFAKRGVWCIGHT